MEWRDEDLAQPVSADNVEHGAKVLNQLFEAARLHGVFVRVGNES